MEVVARLDMLLEIIDDGVKGEEESDGAERIALENSSFEGERISFP